MDAFILFSVRCPRPVLSIGLLQQKLSWGRLFQPLSFLGALCTPDPALGHSSCPTTTSGTVSWHRSLKTAKNAIKWWGVECCILKPGKYPERKNVIEAANMILMLCNMLMRPETPLTKEVDGNAFYSTRKKKVEEKDFIEQGTSVKLGDNQQPRGCSTCAIKEMTNKFSYKMGEWVMVNSHVDMPGLWEEGNKSTVILSPQAQGGPQDYRIFFLRDIKI